MPGETAASCEVPSEPVPEREGEAPVQAVRVPETPDITVGTSMEAPAAGALAVQVVGHQDDEACGWIVNVPSRAQWQEDCVRGAVVALHQASDAMQAGKKTGRGMSI